MTLPEIIERLEKATGPNREMDAAIAAAVHIKMLTYQPGEWLTDPPYTASLDAALTDEKIVGMTFVDGWTAVAVSKTGEQVSGHSKANEAIARRIAALKARLSSQKKGSA